MQRHITFAGLDFDWVLFLSRVLDGVGFGSGLVLVLLLLMLVVRLSSKSKPKRKIRVKLIRGVEP